MSDYSAQFLMGLGLSLILVAYFIVIYVGIKRKILTHREKSINLQKAKLTDELIVNSMIFENEGRFEQLGINNSMILAKVFANMVAFLDDEKSSRELVAYCSKLKLEKTLIKLSKSKNEEDRIMACQALRFFRNRADALIEVAKTDLSQRVRVEAILSLVHSYKRPSFEEWSRWISLASPTPNVAIKSLFKRSEIIGIHNLRKIILRSNCDDMTKTWALDEVANRDPARANSIVEKLINTDNLPKPYIRTMINIISSPRLLSIAFARFSNSPHWELREACCKTAASIYAFELLDSVMALINDSDFRVHRAAMQATKILAGIGEFPDPRAIRYGAKPISAKTSKPFVVKAA